MTLRIKPLSFIFLLLLIVCSSSLAIMELGSTQLAGEKMQERFMLHKSDEVEVKKMGNRKLMLHSTADYDDAGPNPKHDPRRRSGGKG